MGKVVSTVCKIVSPLVTLVNPVAGVLLSGTAAIADAVNADNQRRQLNTRLDLEMEVERANQLKAEQLRLEQHLEEIQNLYIQNYGYLSDSKAIMEEYYLTIQHKLSAEKIVIDNLEEILELLHCCCIKNPQNYDYIITKLHQYRNEIFILLQWGLMHVALLSGEEAIYREVIELSKDTIDCLEIDSLGHSILEYAYLLGDQKLILQLRSNQYAFEQIKFINASRLIVAKKKLMLNFTNDFEENRLTECIDLKDYELAQALITLGHLPTSLVAGENLIKTLISEELNYLLDKTLQQTNDYLNSSLIHNLENSYLSPRNFSKENAILKLKTFLWLKSHGFKGVDDVNLHTHETPLEVAIKEGSQQDFFNLLKCNANLSYINHQGDTLLMIAIRENKTSIVEYLIKKHEVDPRIYNFSLNNGLLIASECNEKIQNLIVNFSNRLVLEEKQFFKSINSQVSDLMMEHVLVNILSQASNYYRLLQKGKRSTNQVRLPIILGLYVLSVKQMMPLDENELSWIANKLELRVNYNSKEYNFIDSSFPLIQIEKTSQGFAASWDDNYLQVIEPEVQYMFPSSNYDLDLNIDDDLNIAFININNYINNNYLMLENFKKNHIRSRNNSTFRLDELSIKPNITCREFINNKYNFVYYYDMPERDSGYHTLGISRFTAAKLLMDNLYQEEILNCIKIEWVNWIISLYSLPPEVSNINNINNLIINYKKAKKLLEAEPENQHLFQNMQFQFNCLYNLSNKEYCAMYIVKFIIAPHNALNALKYYPAIGNIPQGGTLVALAKIIKLNINIYRLELNNLENIFSLQINNAIETIDILKHCSINNSLHKISILSKNIRLHLKPIITHVDLFASFNKNSDLGTIFHGWFNFLADRSLITPQNDILALLLAVKSKMINADREVNLLAEINQFRLMLSQELSLLLGKQFKEFKELDHYWVNVAEQKVKNIAREYLLKEHCKIIDNHQNQYLVIKEMLNIELNNKFSRLHQEQTEFNRTFEEMQNHLIDWMENAKRQAIEDSNKQRLQINNSINKYLSQKHHSIKKHSKKLIKNSVINFVVDYAFSQMPKFKDFPRKILMKSANAFTKSVLNQEELDLKKIAGIGFGQIVSTVPFNETIFQTAVKGMTENFIAGMIYEKNSKDIIRTTILGGMQSVCTFGVLHHIKFSDAYVNAIFAGSVDSVLEGIKKDHLNIEDILITAANKVALNLDKLKAYQTNIIYNKHNPEKHIFGRQFIFYKEKYSNYFNITRFDSEYNQHDNQNLSVFNLSNKYNFDKYWEQSILDKLVNFNKQEIQEQYGLNETQIIRRQKFPKVAMFFDGVNEAENSLNNHLHKFKDNSLSFLQNKIDSLKHDLISLELSISNKIILHSKKIATQTTLFAAEKFLPASTSELRSNILKAAISSELYFMYKLGEEFKIPGTNIKIAPLGNRKNNSLGKFPHYHRRVINPKDPKNSLPGQGMTRHRPWETRKDKQGKKLDYKFTDRF